MSDRGGEQRLLIVNADDFGLCPAVNQGVIESYEHGVVTSASLMVGRGSSEAAAEYLRSAPAFSAGLHLDLGEWEWRDGGWWLAYPVVDTASAEEVAEEVDRQIVTFVALVGRPPTHLDSHQHVHLDEPARSAVVAAGERLGGVPVRSVTPEIRHDGSFYGQTGEGEPLPGALDLARFFEILEGLPAGVTELAVHPGWGDLTDLSYGAERSQEVAVLCDPSLPAALHERAIVLTSFAALRSP